MILKKENDNKPMLKAVSLFAGIGGADLGLTGGFKFLEKYYSKNGVKIVYANDIDKFACETYKENFGDHIVCSDISEVSSQDIPNHNILVGGFPCQPFSIAGGRKGVRDARGKLFHEMVRIIKEKQPEVFIAENVKGILSSNSGKDFKKILGGFRKTGYNLSWALLNSADYGVPQKRERIFIVGVRSDKKTHFAFPNTTHAKNSSKGIAQWVPLKKALDCVFPKDKKYIFSDRAVEGLLNANAAFNKGRHQNLDEPCNTISAHLAKVSLNGTDPVLKLSGRKLRYRRFTPREASRIQSFPDDYALIGSELRQYRQIGNAIPPVLFWHIAKAVVDQIFVKEFTPLEVSIVR